MTGAAPDTTPPTTNHTGPRPGGHAAVYTGDARHLDWVLPPDLFGQVAQAPCALPVVGTARVVRIRIVVDFPAPFGPSRPKTAPGSAAKLTPSRARIFPR